MRRLLLLGGLLYLLLLAGLVTLVGELIAVAIPLAVYLVAALVYGPDELRLAVTRTIRADRVFDGDEVEVGLAVTNQGSDIERAVVEDLLPPPLELLEGEACVSTSLAPGECFELRYVVRARRGHYQFGDVWVTASDQLGLLCRKEVLTAQASFSALPRVPKPRPVAIRPLRTRGYAGPVPARQGGSGIDFFGVREYQAGDPQRWINWRASARHPRTLFSNEFEQERIADVGLILDARSRSQVRISGESLFEHAVRATAALADSFLADGNRVGLLVYGQFLDWTFPGYGRVQRERILQALARAETGESRVFSNLDYLPTRFFPAQSQVVMVSPLWWDDLPVLSRFRARGYQVLVIRPDAVSFEEQMLRSDNAIHLAARIVRVERALLLRKLQQAGIQVVDWRVEQPFDQVLHTSLGRRQPWFRAVGMEL